jgi:hypothetical protein
MSNLSNDYSQLYDDMSNQSTVSNLTSLTDAYSSNLSMSIGIKKEYTGNNNLLISNSNDASNLTLNDNINIGLVSGIQLTNSSNQNTGCGYRSIRHADNSSENSSFGNNCLSGDMQMCNRNTGFGIDCLKNISTGANDNSCIGVNCCNDAISDNSLTCIGSNIKSNGLNGAIAIGSLPSPQFINIFSTDAFFLPFNLAEVPNNANSKLMAKDQYGQVGPINLANSNGYIKYDSINGYSYDNPSSAVTYSSFCYIGNSNATQQIVTGGLNIPYNNATTFVFHGPNLRRPLDSSKYAEVLINGTYRIDVTYNIISNVNSICTIYKNLSVFTTI